MHIKRQRIVDTQPNNWNAHHKIGCWRLIRTAFPRHHVMSDTADYGKLRETISSCYCENYNEMIADTIMLKYRFSLSVINCIINFCVETFEWSDGIAGRLPLHVMKNMNRIGGQDNIYTYGWFSARPHRCISHRYDIFPFKIRHASLSYIEMSSLKHLKQRNPKAHWETSIGLLWPIDRNKIYMQTTSPKGFVEAMEIP